MDCNCKCSLLASSSDETRHNYIIMTINFALNREDNLVKSQIIDCQIIVVFSSNSLLDFLGNFY